MNSKFNENQIKAYASAFKEGDAVFVNGNWEKVVKHHDYYLDDYSLAGSRCTYAIKRIGEYGEKPKTEGFSVDAAIDVSEQYRVTTITDYKLQGGEKLVWLGEDIKHLTFGRVYDAFIGSSGYISLGGDGLSVLRASDYEEWGIIPRYEQVRSNEQKEVKTSDIANVLYKRYYDVLQNALHNDIENALQDSDYQKVVELSGLIIEMEEGK